MPTHMQHAVSVTHLCYLVGSGKHERSIYVRGLWGMADNVAKQCGSKSQLRQLRS